MTPIGEVGGIVLCGGQSRRMGRPKALLPLGHRTLLEHMLDRISEQCQPCIVVAAEGQGLPRLTESIQVCRDLEPEQGPLPALVLGLQALVGRTRWAFVTAVDLPQLQVGWIDRLLTLSGPTLDLVLPHCGGHDQVLAALYRVEAVSKLVDLVSRGERRLRKVKEVLQTRIVGPEHLLDIDPKLTSVQNLNTLEAYQTYLNWKLSPSSSDAT